MVLKQIVDVFDNKDLMNRIHEIISMTKEQGIRLYNFQDDKEYIKEFLRIGNDGFYCLSDKVGCK